MTDVEAYEETAHIRREMVPVYSIRTEDGDRNRFARRAIEGVLRWHPPSFDQIEGKKGPMNAPAVRALHGLEDGGTIGLDAMRALVAALVEAKVYYQDAPEPFEGRNAEAVADFDAMLEACAAAGVRP